MKRMKSLWRVLVCGVVAAGSWMWSATTALGQQRGSLLFEQGNLLVNEGFESGLSGWSILQGSPSTREYPEGQNDQLDPQPHSLWGDHCFYGGSGSAFSTIRQSFSITDPIEQMAVDDDLVHVYAAGYFATYAGTPFDYAWIEVISPQTGVLIDTEADALSDSPTNNVYELQRSASLVDVPPGTRTIDFFIHADRDEGQNNNAYGDRINMEFNVVLPWSTSHVQTSVVQGGALVLDSPYLDLDPYIVEYQWDVGHDGIEDVFSTKQTESLTYSELTALLGYTPAPGELFPVAATITNYWGEHRGIVYVVEVVNCPGGVVYIDADAPPGGNGSSWGSAFNELKPAIDAIHCVDATAMEFRIAEGTYTPHASDRDASFELASNMTIRGGYAGVGEPDPDAWDPETYMTILSGDLNGDDFARGGIAGRGLMNAENSYHVMLGSSVTDVVVEGVTITGGNANFPAGGSNARGGGISLGGVCTITLIDCHITDNSAEDFGGGFYQTAGTAEFQSCVLSGNIAGHSGGAVQLPVSHTDAIFAGCEFTSNVCTTGSGGAIFAQGDQLELSDCTLFGNSAALDGGAMYITAGGECEFSDCDMVNNAAGQYGGAAHHDGTTSVAYDNCMFDSNQCTVNGGAVSHTTGSGAFYTHCIFVNNTAQNDGGALRIEDCLVNINNCLIISNSAQDGAGLLVEAPDGNASLRSCTIAHNNATGVGGGMRIAAGTNASARNCIYWQNVGTASPDVQNEQVDDDDGSGIFLHCCIEGWDTTLNGSDCHGANPLFLDPDGPDDIHGTLDDDYRLDHRSLCIDFGDDASVPAPLTEDILGNPRIVNCVDIGAIEHDGVSTDMIDFGCDANSAVACFQEISPLPTGDGVLNAFLSADGQFWAGTYSSGSDRFSYLGSVSGVVRISDHEVTAISPDSSVVVGDDEFNQAFTWSRCDDGVTLLDLLPGGTFAVCEDVSDNGTVVVGQGNTDVSSHVIRWVNGGPPEALGDLPGGDEMGRATGVTADGQVIVGFSRGADGYEAVSWTNGGPPLALGEIVGGSFRSEAHDVSDDGSVIVGYSHTADGQEACVFDPSGFDDPIGIGDLPGGNHISRATVVSGDGRVSGGFGHDDSGDAAFIYTEWTGMLNLRDLLEDEYDLDLTGWRLIEVLGLSHDGTTITGDAINPDDVTVGFIAHLPYLPPCSADIVPAPQGDGVINLFDLLLLLDNWGTNGAGADISAEGGGDTVVDLFDLLAMLDAWGFCPGP